MNQNQLTMMEQLIRIALYMLGSFLFGDGVAQSAEYQAGIGAIISTVSFIWWLLRMKSVSKS